MRFFIGSAPGSGNKKKTSASDMFKRKMKGQAEVKLTADEKYQQAMDERIAKMTEEIMLGKKKGFQLPGTKQAEDEAPKELTKTQKLMLQLLAQKKVTKEHKLMKKKEQQAAELQKSAKRALQQKATDAANAQYEKQQQELNTTPQKSYFFGSEE